MKIWLTILAGFILAVGGFLFAQDLSAAERLSFLEGQLARIVQQLDRIEQKVDRLMGR